MSGCGTSLQGRAIIEVYEAGIQVLPYEVWVKNYISAQRGVIEGLYTPEEADWSEASLYIKEADSPELTPVSLDKYEDESPHVVHWTYWDYWKDGELPYRANDMPLIFSYDPYGGLSRYTLTIVPYKYGDLVPESWNGSLLFDEDCPLKASGISRDVWEWVDAHTLTANVSGDVLVTPYGEDPGVPNPIATREVVVRQN